MINSKESYLFYLKQDFQAWGGHRFSFPKPDGFVLQLKLRKLEYFLNTKSKILYKFYKFFFFDPFLKKVGASIGPNCFGPGLYLPHPIGVIVHESAKIGKNCKIQQEVTIGQTGGSQEIAIIGDNVFIGAGAKVVGKIIIADGVAIGANAVVCRDIMEKNTTWGGVPAHKISNKGSHEQLTPSLLQSQ